MKKTVLAAGGVLALAALYYVGQTLAQAPASGAPAAPAPAASAPAATAPRTRIALLNLTYVIKNYEKYKHFQEEIKSVIEPFQKTDAELRKRMEDLNKQMEETAKKGGTVNREELDRQGKDLKRKLEDNSAEAKMVLGKKSDDEMKILFMDVYEAARRYAISHEFDLVLHYNDATTPEDYMSPQNIARKLNTGALSPLYVGSGMDISVEVVNMLNYNVRPGSGSGATPAQSAPRSGGGGSQ
ncbi:MAG TPA: OmpH family outer membrane protein [Gemmataceae bacterium]